MALSKTYYTSANLAFADVTTALRQTASHLFALKGLLTQVLTGTAGTGGQPPSSAAWTVDSSSDGTTASSGDNLGGATFTAAKWVRAAAASAHTWFVLKSPVSSGILDGPYYLMVSMGTTSDTNLIFGLSKVQPTGGTATADPTASGQSLYTAAAVMPGSTAAGRGSLVTDAKGNFHYVAALGSTGRFHFYCGVSELVETRSTGDSARAVLVVDFLNSGVGVPRFGDGVSAGQGWRGLAQDGVTAVTSSTGKIMGLVWNANTDSLTRTGTNSIDSKTDAIPVGYMYDTTVGHSGLRGRIPDVWGIGAQVTPGSGSPTAATPDRICAGSSLIPFSVVPSL